MQNNILQRSIHDLRIRKLGHNISEYSRSIQSITIPRTSSTSPPSSLSTRRLRGPIYNMFRYSQFFTKNLLFLFTCIDHIFDVRNSQRGFSYISRNNKHSSILSFLENFLLIFHRQFTI